MLEIQQTNGQLTFFVCTEIELENKHTQKKRGEAKKRRDQLGSFGIKVAFKIFIFCIRGSSTSVELPSGNFFKSQNL